MDQKKIYKSKTFKITKYTFVFAVSVAAIRAVFEIATSGRVASARSYYDVIETNRLGLSFSVGDCFEDY